jgi:hypothetical protein
MNHLGLVLIGAIAVLSVPGRAECSAQHSGPGGWTSMFQGAYYSWQSYGVSWGGSFSIWPDAGCTVLSDRLWFDPATELTRTSGPLPASDVHYTYKSGADYSDSYSGQIQLVLTDGVDLFNFSIYYTETTPPLPHVPEQPCQPNYRPCRNVYTGAVECYLVVGNKCVRQW